MGNRAPTPGTTRQSLQTANPVPAQGLRPWRSFGQPLSLPFSQKASQASSQRLRGQEDARFSPPYFPLLLVFRAIQRYRMRNELVRRGNFKEEAGLWLSGWGIETEAEA